MVNSGVMGIGGLVGMVVAAAMKVIASILMAKLLRVTMNKAEVLVIGRDQVYSNPYFFKACLFLSCFVFLQWPWGTQLLRISSCRDWWMKTRLRKSKCIHFIRDVLLCVCFVLFCFLTAHAFSRAVIYSVCHSVSWFTVKCRGVVTADFPTHQTYQQSLPRQRYTRTSWRSLEWIHPALNVGWWFSAKEPHLRGRGQSDWCE